MNKVFHYYMRASDITLERLFNNGSSRVVCCSMQGGRDDNDLYFEISIIYFREFCFFSKIKRGPGPIVPPPQGAVAPLKVLGPWASGGLRAQKLPGAPGPQRAGGSLGQRAQALGPSSKRVPGPRGAVLAGPGGTAFLRFLFF